MSTNYLSIAKMVAKETGDFLLRSFKKKKEIFSKHDRNLVTNFDIEAEKLIVSQIKQAFPAHGILSEEKENLRGNDYLWIIDPLDGTHNFIRGMNIFGVSVALAYKEEVILGVIYMPRDKHMYWAKRGKGAYLNGKKISVSSTKKVKDASVSFDSSIRYDPGEILKVLDRTSRSVFNIRMLGSSARLLSFVAQGILDAAIEFNDEPWDCAAGKVIIEEAGGIFTALDGSPWRIDMKGYLATNGSLHRSFLKIINP